MPLWLMLILITVVVGVVATLVVNRVPDGVLAPVFKSVLLWGSVIGLVIMWLWYLFTQAGLTVPHVR